MYAVRCEITDHADSYKYGIPKETDSAIMLLHRIKKLSKSEASCVKWRKAFIAAFLCIGLMLFLQGQKTNSEIILLFFICFFCYFMVIQIHSKTVYNKTHEHLENCLVRLKKILKRQ